MTASGGPLLGLRVVEIAGIGPAPHAAMVLADLGADVVRIDRPLRDGAVPAATGHELVLRGRRLIRADLKDPADRADVLGLIERADVLVEGLRPGVMERLGLGPDECLSRNPRLVYGRVTGWGQTGPMSNDVGHDINYIALTGALHAMGRAGEAPAPPLNLVGDFGGGSMLLVVGVLAALFERGGSGRGQVIDAAMVDGTALLSQLVLSLRTVGGWVDERQANLLDGGAPFYDTYACADGRFVAVGAIEERFFAALCSGLELDAALAASRWDRSAWPALRSAIGSRLATRTRDEWVDRFAATEACVTPVLDFREAAEHPHLVARGSLVRSSGGVTAAPAPRFSRTPADPVHPTEPDPVTASDILADWR